MTFAALTMRLAFTAMGQRPLPRNPPTVIGIVVLEII
jgi:hypothetical protein